MSTTRSIHPPPHRLITRESSQLLWSVAIPRSRRFHRTDQAFEREVWYAGSTSHQATPVAEISQLELEEFAESIQQLAFVAYPNSRDKAINDASVDALLHSCRDKCAALWAMDQHPFTLSKAMVIFKGSIHSRRALFGERGRIEKVRQGNFYRSPIRIVS